MRFTPRLMKQLPTKKVRIIFVLISLLFISCIHWVKTRKNQQSHKDTHVHLEEKNTESSLHRIIRDLHFFHINRFRLPESKDIKAKITFSQEKSKRRNIIENPDYSIQPPERIHVSDSLTPYKRFNIKTNFQEDKWIKEIEFVVHPKIVHHIVFEIHDQKISKAKNTCSKLNQFKTCVYLTSRFGWGLGMKKHKTWPFEAGIKIPAKAEIFLEIHYESIGREVIDDTTEVRFLFHKTPPENQLVSLKLYDTLIKIPPGDSNYKSELAYRLKESSTLIGVTVHMHLRGKASSILIIKPGEKEEKGETIFSLDPWHFNFHRDYWFKEPIKISHGATLKCINWFDNSSKNPVNPDPEQTVLWGLQTKDEMSACAFFFMENSSKKSFLTYKISMENKYTLK